MQELTHTLNSIDEVQAEKFVQLTDEADGMFCVGARRSGLQVKGSAMRLMRMSVASYVVRETCTPNIKGGDILMMCNESGETKLLTNHAAEAKEMGARVVLITINPNPSIANMANVIVEINAPSPKSTKQGDIKPTWLIGSPFEQSEGTFMDIAVMMLVERRGKDPDTMFERHTNME